MTKLGKTATKILAHMESRYGRYGATWATGHGAEGGRLNEGSREYMACLELIKKGYAVECGRHRDVHYQNGWGMHCAEITIKLPGME